MRRVKIAGHAIPAILLTILIASGIAAATLWALKAGYITITVVKPAPGAYVITATVDVGEVGAGHSFHGSGWGRLSLVDVSAIVWNNVTGVDLDPEELYALDDLYSYIYIENATHLFRGTLTIVKDGALVNAFDGWYYWDPAALVPVYVGDITLAKGHYDLSMWVNGFAGYPLKHTTVDCLVMIYASTP